MLAAVLDTFPLYFNEASGLWYLGNVAFVILKPCKVLYDVGKYLYYLCSENRYLHRIASNSCIWFLALAVDS